MTQEEKAAREAIDEVRGNYPEDIFPDPDESKDATKVPQAAVFKMARLTCDNIREAFERKLNEQKEENYE